MHPAIPAEGRQLGADGVIIKSLASFHQFNFEPILRKLGIENPLIVLGSNTQFTIWSVIDVETSWVFGSNRPVEPSFASGRIHTCANSSSKLLIRNHQSTISPQFAKNIDLSQKPKSRQINTFYGALMIIAP